MENSDQKQATTIVEIVDGGPVKIRGQMIIKDLKRDIQETSDEVYICRCGQSTTKPFCDRSHKK